MDILQIFTLLGALGMFLYGMNLMSAGLQKASGNKLRSLLSAMTSNPFKGVLTGLGITSIIQSSSATTVMVVGFVNAGLLTLAQAIGVIMGANIGTTVTAWLVSWLGFKADISILAVPLMAFGFLFSISKKEKRRNIGELIVGFSLLFIGLGLMKEAVPALDETHLGFVTEWANHGFGSVLIFLLFGTVLTLILQSSSATMAITLIMLSMGWIPFDMACAMVLGENIGTTITANIAAAVGNTLSKRAAMSHTIFNVFGVVWALILFKPFLGLVGLITETLFGLPNPAAEGFAVPQIAAGSQATQLSPESIAALYGLSMLHTLFNTINAAILIWFIPQIEKMVTFIIRTPADLENEVFRLKYISAGPIATPELATEEAFEEIIHFAQISKKGLGYAREAINESNPDKIEKLREKLVKYEEISDRIEFEIASFLNALSTGEISNETANKVNAMYKIIGELESLGDSGEAISRILSRRDIHKKIFDVDTKKKLEDMVEAVEQAYEAMIYNLQAAQSGILADITNACNAEARINNLRNHLRDFEIEELENNKKNYQTTVYYMDIVNELERMGDFIINISQDLERAFINK